MDKIKNVLGDTVLLNNQKDKENSNQNTFIEENSDPEYLFIIDLKQKVIDK